MAETISQRVNALFARYVALEAEQIRQSDLGTKEGDAAADALGTPALAIMDEINGIQDRTASADLIGARTLLDLMLGHRWTPEKGISWGYDARTYSLPLLETLSDRLTGAVRTEARRALATIGVEIPAAEIDPFVERMNAFLADVVAFNAHSDTLGDAAPDPFGPLAAELESGALRIGSTAGGAMALRQVIANDAVGCTESQLLIAKTLEFLEADEAGPATMPHDPLLELIQTFRANYDVAIENHDADRAAGREEEAAATWRPLWDRLSSAPPAATTLAGVQAALQFIHDENDGGDYSEATRSVAGAALSYFGRA